MPVAPPDAIAIAQAFTDAMNRGEHEEAAQLLAPDVGVSLPGGTLAGRDAWLESRRQQGSPEHLTESVEVDELRETDDGVELTGHLVQRWTETGEPAGELPVRIVFAVDGGLISRLELRPG